MEGATFPPTLKTEKKFEENESTHWNFRDLFTSFLKKCRA